MLRTLWWENLCDVITFQPLVAHLEAAGSDGIMRAPLLPSRGNFCVFECKMSFFLVGSCLFLLMVVQQFIVILRFL